MAKKEKVEEQPVDFNLDMEGIKEAQAETEVPMRAEEPIKHFVPKTTKARDKDDPTLINCLRSEVITVKHLPQPGSIMDPKHVLYGGLAENSTVTFTVPRLRSGVFKDVLTKSEKDYLEMILGLEQGALNVYNKVNNFWDNSTEDGISKVRLTKMGTQLHLDDPIEYIYYKILLANKDKICPDLQTLTDKPKATYQFVLISDQSVSSIAKSKMDTKKKCWIEYGKIEDNAEMLKAIIEIITAKPVAANTKLDFLQTKAGELMDSDARLFLSVVQDPYLSMKVLIKKCVEQGFISKRGDWYYLRSDGSPLCEGGEEPTLTAAARFLANPKRQDMKFALEAKVK